MTMATMAQEVEAVRLAANQLRARGEQVTPGSVQLATGVTGRCGGRCGGGTPDEWISESGRRVRITATGLSVSDASAGRSTPPAARPTEAEEIAALERQVEGLRRALHEVAAAHGKRFVPAEQVREFLRPDGTVIAVVQRPEVQQYLSTCGPWDKAGDADRERETLQREARTLRALIDNPQTSWSVRTNAEGRLATVLRELGEEDLQRRPWRRDHPGGTPRAS